MSKDLYQKALNELEDIICELLCELKEDYELYTRGDTNYEKHVYKLQELISKNSLLTIDECIKKWESRNYRFAFQEITNTITITDNTGNGILIDRCDNTFTLTKWLGTDLIDLLYKTLRALEESKND